MNIALMGGTFNPVHLAHLRIAEEARQLCSLDRIVFLPAADPPHKPLAGEVPFSLRCEMVRLAIADNPFFELSDLEGHRPGKSYSIDTITIFKENYPDDSLFFIIGSDSFEEIGLWYRYADILRACNLIVVERPGRPLCDLLAVLPSPVKSEFVECGDRRMLQHNTGTTVQCISGTLLDISSSRIRQMVHSGQSIKYLVPVCVDEYIKKQRIYTPCL